MSAPQLSTATIAARLADPLADQDGLLTRRQALSAGMTPRVLQRRLSPGGRWQRVLPGTYATFTGRLSTAQRWVAALLYGGPDSMLGGATAARLHGLRQLPDDARVHLLVPHPRQLGSTGFVVVRRTIHPPAPIWFEEVLRAAPLPRAVVDACRGLPHLDQVRALVAEAVQRRLVDPAELNAELRRGCSAGSALPRAVLAEVGAGIRSVAEARTRKLVRSAGISEPLWNCPLYTSAGEWLAQPDGFWPEANSVVEVDSMAWHLSPRSWENTLRRHARMTACGLLVVHFTPLQVDREPDLVIDVLRRTLAQGILLPPARVRLARS